MFLGFRDDGACEIKGDEQELREFMATVREALETGDSEAAILDDGGFVIPVYVVCEDA